MTDQSSMLTEDSSISTLGTQYSDEGTIVTANTELSSINDKKRAWKKARIIQKKLDAINMTMEDLDLWKASNPAIYEALKDGVRNEYELACAIIRTISRRLEQQKERSATPNEPPGPVQAPMNP